MTETTETEGVVDPKDQAAAQTGNPNAAPGEPGHYSPPDPTAGVTKSPANEVRPKRLVEEAERIPDTRSDWDKRQAGEGAEGTAPAQGEIDYESHTVPELREMAAARGIEVKSDARKDEIIEALKKG